MPEEAGRVVNLAEQEESEADPDASPDEVDQWRALLQLVDAGTEEPDDCYFGLWEG